MPKLQPLEKSSWTRRKEIGSPTKCNRKRRISSWKSKDSKKLKKFNRSKRERKRKL